jgi:hypothetical protein
MEQLKKEADMNADQMEHLRKEVNISMSGFSHVNKHFCVKTAHCGELFPQYSKIYFSLPSE